MKLKDIGEFGLIEKVSKRTKVDKSVMVGIGDDAAVIRQDKKHYLLFTSDMIIEGIHFDLERSRPFDIGWKALGVNLSDIAAMGGIPRYAVISAGLPKRLDLRYVENIYSGLKSLARRFGVNIVGGDTTSSDKLVIDISVIGRARKRELVLRSGAKAGDVLMVTGSLGGSIKGRHLRFTPRIHESQFLVRNFKINSMIDISDGLSGDLMHLCRQSRVGAKIYESLIPVSKEGGSIRSALQDGEDFELLFTASKYIFMYMLRKFRKRFRTPISVIGEITKKNRGIAIIDRNGRSISLKESGFRHF
jgi:thiamine-monophosphate kinase